MIGTQVSVQPAPDASPQLIAANAILQLSTVELEQAINRELNENPALEAVEQPPLCHRCGSRLRSDSCLHCSTDPYTTPRSFNGLEEAQSEEIDPLNFVQAPLTLTEQLFSQLRLILDREDYAVALYVVESLDGHGYLTMSNTELARMLHVETSCVDTIVKELQGLEPAGIAAHNLIECLLLQLERLIEKGKKPPTSTRAIIEHHLPELGHHQFESIRVALQVSRSEVEESFLFIRTNLHPYPAHHYYTHMDNNLSGGVLPTPSVIIHRSKGSNCGYDIEIIEARRFHLSLNPLYQQSKHQPGIALSSTEREHITQYAERARLFMGQLQRRTHLLQRVMMYLVHYQRDFLDHGSFHLRPLSQKIVAQALNVHVSMISRTISGKYAQLPSQELIPLHRFFSGEFQTQEIIRRIIAKETEALSDAHIARLLSTQHSISLTRQMVANYREELHIPAARQRTILRRTQGRS